MINELRKILEEAPDGATHYDGTDYYYAHFVPSPDHCIWNIYDKGNKRFTVVGDMYLDECMKFRSLSDIKLIVEMFDSLNFINHHLLENLEPHQFSELVTWGDESEKLLGRLK